MRHLAIFALLVSLPVAGHACRNDRDSDALIIQNKRLPDAIRVISGRFERNPRRYFEMRAGRVEKELKANPRQLGLYDDLAVAHDSLGDDVAAMKVMAQKRALLPKYNPDDKANKEAWYRYYANDGTFRAHQYLHGGAKIERIAEMKEAREEIKRAIQIKPDAHFGRERVQLMVMDWIIAKKKWKTYKTLGQWIAGRDGSQIDYGTEPIKSEEDGKIVEIEPGRKGDSPQQIAAKERLRRETAEGLTGLVVLGAAWDSPDVFEALANVLGSKETIALRYLALLRCRELLENKKPSLAALSIARVNKALAEINSEEWEWDGVGINAPNKKTLDSLYPQLRAEAKEWNANRTRWMEAQFKRGQHPDTIPTFWQGYQETAPPSLDVAWFNQKESTNRMIIGGLALAAVLFIVLPITLLVLLVVSLRRRKARQTSMA